MHLSESYLNPMGQDVPANPFELFSIPELLEQFAYHAKARRERAGKMAALP